MVFFLPYETHQHRCEDFPETAEGDADDKLRFLIVLELKSEIDFRI